MPCEVAGQSLPTEQLFSEFKPGRWLGTAGGRIENFPSQVSKRLDLDLTECHDAGVILHPFLSPATGLDVNFTFLYVIVLHLRFFIPWFD